MHAGAFPRVRWLHPQGIGKTLDGKQARRISLRCACMHRDQSEMKVRTGRWKGREVLSAKFDKHGRSRWKNILHMLLYAPASPGTPILILRFLYWCSIRKHVPHAGQRCLLLKYSRVFVMCHESRNFIRTPTEKGFASSVMNTLSGT